MNDSNPQVSVIVEGVGHVKVSGEDSLSLARQMLDYYESEYLCGGRRE